MDGEIVIKGARLHNLKRIDVTIPKNRLVVLTGVSGSGKSTLAMDTINKEGARQYMESLGFVSHESRPAVDSISGLSPTISVDQHLTNRSPRSTVGTASEIYTYLRVLFARLGHRPCPHCGRDVPPASSAVDEDWEGEEIEDIEGSVPCPHCGGSLPELSMGSFSFNKPAGACPVCTGIGETADVLEDKLFDLSRSVTDGGVLVWDPYNTNAFIPRLVKAGEYYGFPFDPNQPIGEYGPAQHDLLWYGVASEQFKARFPNKPLPTSVGRGYFEGVVTNLRRRYNEGLSDSGLRVRLDKDVVRMDSLIARQPCPGCGGTRLRPESRAVTVRGRTIMELSALSLEALNDWTADLPAHLQGDELLIAGPVIGDMLERLRRFIDIGVGYLSMERSSPTLSAGEQQRMRLAQLLGSGLTGVTYVLDEPTIGLHQRDTLRMIGVLRQLRDLGNTVLVIEHDLEVIGAADHVIEFGPGAGKGGGWVVTTGTPAQVAASPSSPTGAYLSGREVFAPAPTRPASGRSLAVRGAREHNLKNISVEFPLGRLVAVTGVSGSGKSSLVFDVLDRAAQQRFNGAAEPPGAHDAIAGWEQISRVVTVDQSPIGRVPRSNAATYTEVFTPIRETFAATPAARAAKIPAGHFSFNVPGGRCERCEGAGVLTVNMHFLPDVQVRCPACKGRRFKKDVLAVQYNGASVADVLEMTIEEAAAVFAKIPAVAGRLEMLKEVGLGYLQLGQPATTLSGGEAQRVKLARELARRGGEGHTLYLLDEPTTGLHPADVARLHTLLRRLVDADNTVILVEHHIELIRACDWVIDLGPEGGDAGGQLLAEGTPEQVAAVEASRTGQSLRSRMQEASR